MCELKLPETLDDLGGRMISPQVLNYGETKLSQDLKQKETPLP